MLPGATPDAGTLLIIPIHGTEGMEFSMVTPFIGSQNKRSITAQRSEVTFLRQTSRNHLASCDRTKVAPFNAIDVDVVRVFDIIRQWTETSTYAQHHENAMTYLRENTTTQKILNGLAHQEDPLKSQSYLMGDQLMFMVFFFLINSDLPASDDPTVNLLREWVVGFNNFHSLIGLSLDDLGDSKGIIGFEITLTSISLYIWK